MTLQVQTWRTLAGLAAISALLVGCSRSGAPHRRELSEILERVIQTDRAIPAFRSKVLVKTYDASGQPIEPDKSGFRLYVKPDLSLVCASAPDGPPESAAELRTIVKTRKGGTAETTTLPDSYFLRDLGSMLTWPLEAATTERHPSKPQFQLDSESDAAEEAKGIYTLNMVHPGYEKAVLKVQADSGAILQKTVYDAAGAIKSRETYSAQAPISGGFLPGQTIYEWAGRTAIVRLWDYHVEAPRPASFFENDESACDALAATFGGRGPLEAQLRGIARELAH